MNNKIISQIHKNIRSVTLMKNHDYTYSVTTREGVNYKHEVFSQLVDALKYYNDLSGLLFDRHTKE